MSESTPANPDMEPMTIAHGRKLFEQSRGIAALLDQLRPLLTLIEEKDPGIADEPIAKIVELLTCISTAQQKQDQFQILDRKLDFIIVHLTAGEQFSGSLE